VSPPSPSRPSAEWTRLHPLSPLVRFGRLIAALAVLLIPTAQSLQRGHRNQGLTLLLWLGLVSLGAIGGFISWAVTRWRVQGGALQIETGVLRRQSIRIPLTRVQAVDVVAPLLARVFGLAEVRVVSAGRGAERGRLAYLPAAQAQAVRAELLALSHGLAAETPEPPAMLMFHVDNAQLVAGFCLRGQFLVPLTVFGALIGLGAGLHDAATFGAGITAAVTHALLVARTFNEEYDLSLGEAGDGLRLDRGLLQRRHETIPHGRIQAVRLLEPLLWRPFGWARLEVDIARQQVRREDQEPHQVIRALVPVADRAMALAVVGRVMPAAGVDPPASSGAPRRAVLRAPLSYHLLAAWHDGYHVLSRTGRVRAETVVVPLSKVQSIRLVSGPLQRGLGLASVHVDTAGHRWQARALFRDRREADQLLWTLAGMARGARRRTSAAGPAASPRVAS
jgi:putative membrane protein